jgi:hypothetical protein
MAAALSPMNRAVSKIAKRAEQRDPSVLRDTFVDSGIADVLDMVDHQERHSKLGPQTLKISSPVTVRNRSGKSVMARW